MGSLEWLSLAGICLLGAMSPGPSLLIVLRHAASGVRHGIICALAHGLAIGVYAALTALGLAVVLTGSPTLFTGLQWAGAAMLAYLGWKAVSSPGNSDTAAAAQTRQQSGQPSLLQAATQGFAVAFFNPKVAIFFTALFSQYVALQQSTSGKLALAGLAAGIDAIWYCIVAMAVALGHNRGYTLGKWGNRLQQLFGLLLLALAARLALTI